MRRDHWRCVVREPKAREAWLMIDQCPPTGSGFKRSRQSTYTLDHAKAQALASEREAELNGCVVARNDGTWLEMWDAYAAFRKADAQDPEGTTAESSLGKYGSVRKIVSPHLGALRVADVTEATLTLLQDALRKQVSNRCVNAYLSMVKACWKWGKRRGFVLFDMPNLEWLPETPTKKRPFTKAECEQILMGSLDFVGGRWYPVLRLTYEVGCRIGEALKLRGRDVDRETGNVTLNADISGSRAGRKLGKTRTVVVDALTLACLPVRAPGDLLFPSHRKPGKKLNRRSPYAAFCKICAAIGLDHTDTDLHSFRRKWVRDAARTPGLSPMVAMKFTGHSSLKVFQGYQTNDIEDEMSTVSEAVRNFRSLSLPSLEAVENAVTPPDTDPPSPGAGRARSAASEALRAVESKAYLTPPSLSDRPVSAGIPGKSGEGINVARLVASLSETDRKELLRLLAGS